MLRQSWSLAAMQHSTLPLGRLAPGPGCHLFPEIVRVSAWPNPRPAMPHSPRTARVSAAAHWSWPDAESTLPMPHCRSVPPCEPARPCSQHRPPGPPRRPRPRHQPSPVPLRHRPRLKRQPQPLSWPRPSAPGKIPTARTGRPPTRCCRGFRRGAPCGVASAQLDFQWKPSNARSPSHQRSRAHPP